MNLLEYREFKNIPQYRDYEYYIPFERLQPTITQLFAKRYTDPHNAITRFIFKLGTGTGKTLASLLSSRSYIKNYSIYNKYQVGNFNVFIVGYSESIFRNELMKFEELGFITTSEKNELEHLENQLRKAQKPSAIENLKNKYKNLYSKIKQRISNPNSGGFYRFFGYKKLFNDLFTLFPENIDASNIMDEFKAGRVRVNMRVLEQFRGGYIICDEIHLAYNSAEMNNYGLAIQFILDYYGNDVTASFLSATLINNNKRELIDMANLVRTPGRPVFKSSDYFYSTENEELKAPIDKVIDEFAGKTIFLEENTDDYPDVKYEEIHSPVKPTANKILSEAYGVEKGKEFMKFVESELTPLQEATYEHLGLFEPGATTKNTLIYDMVVPNPDFPAKEILKWNPNHPKHKERKPMFGLTEASEIREKIFNAPDTWKKEIGIDITLKDDYYILSGSWLKKENLAIYSSKAYQVVNIIHERMKNYSDEKGLIYHPGVKDSGIIMISEILKQNGFIEYGDTPKSDTLSAVKWQTYAEAIKAKESNFVPATIFTLEYKVTESERFRMTRLFNNYDNRFGHLLKIYIGSKKIRQSIDFKGIIFQIQWKIPTNIPEFIQIAGRSCRNGSHAQLPKDKQRVSYYVLVNMSKKGETMELRRYRDKIIQFKDIQYFEYLINKAAVNNFIYGKKRFENFNPIGALSFDIKLYESKPSKKSYFYYDNYKYTRDLIFMMIKRAFISCAAWKKEDLWLFILNNPANNIDMTDKLYYEMFEYVLDSLIHKAGESAVDVVGDIFDINNIYIDKYYISGKTHRCIKKVVIAIEDYLIAVPVDRSDNADYSQNSFLKKERIEVQSSYRVEATEVSHTHKLKKYLDSIDNKFKLNSILVIFTPEEHYSILRDHIEGKFILPKEVFKLYKDLNLAGDDWYSDADKLNRYEDKQWDFYNKDPDLRNDYQIVGIINNSFKIKEGASANVDRRLNKRGMTCDTKRKEDLIEICKLLNVSSNFKVSTICSEIYNKMIELEIESLRSQGDKYLYLYNQ